MEVIQSDDLEDQNVQQDKSDPVSVNLVHGSDLESPQNSQVEDRSYENDENEDIILKRLEAEITSVRSEVREKENEFQARKSGYNNFLDANEID
jgi:hypothetical protein